MGDYSEKRNGIKDDVGRKLIGAVDDNREHCSQQVGRNLMSKRGTDEGAEEGRKKESK